MNDEIKEYLNCLNNHIENLEDKLNQLKKEHIEELQKINFSMLESCGIARDAEQITKVAGQLRLLYSIRYDYINIFGITEKEKEDLKDD